MVLSTVNPAVIDQYRLPLTAEGVIVEDPGPYGTRAGLQAGDILRGLNGISFSDSVSAAAALEAVGRSLALEVQRGAQRVVLRLRV